jgi:hypothetical protein
VLADIFKAKIVPIKGMLEKWPISGQNQLAVKVTTANMAGVAGWIWQ